MQSLGYWAGFAELALSIRDRGPCALHRFSCSPSSLSA